MRSLITVASFVLACGAPAPRPRPPTPLAEASPSAPAAVAPESEPEDAPPAAPRLEVAPPASLAAAIAARLPTLELVPQSCVPSTDAIATTRERVCVRDPRSGLSSAVRRFATSSEPAVLAARFGDDVVFAVTDPGLNRTRYSGHTWRWSLADDTYTGLVSVDDDSQIFGANAVDALSFGVLMRFIDEGGSPRPPLLYDGELRRLRAVDDSIGRLFVIEGHTYEIHRERQREVIGEVLLEGHRVRSEPIASYPRAFHLPLTVSFPAGRALSISAYPRGGATTLYVVEPPASEVRQVAVALARPLEAHFAGGELFLRDGAGWHVVDLSTGALTDRDPPPTPSAAPRPASRSVHAIVPEVDALVLVLGDAAFRLGADGVAAIDATPWQEGTAPRAPRSGCRCDEQDLACGEARIAGACADVAALERLGGGDDGLETPSTMHSPEGAIRFRVDRLEPDLTRVTRLSDGARLWVRALDAGVLAQADDGAFVVPEGQELEGLALRWGRSLLEATVTELAPFAEQLRRPTLIEDFFAGRPLPAADTTLPSGSGAAAEG